ncbi:MAG: hypothetical protein KGI37_04470 [Alphaproteobacteria bacterium]|nr:hypothetical protein [Alphaproteobacteria bacterium]
MAGEDSKMQNALWWIASIAVSVLCCSILFVLFAGYLVEVKQDIKESDMRINAIEEREDTILANIEALRKHDAGAVTAVPADNAAGSPAAVPEAAPSVTSAPAPAAPAAVTVPVVPAGHEAAPQGKK